MVSIATDQFSDLSDQDLNKVCKLRGLRIGGTRDELLERLRKHQEEMDRPKTDDEIRAKYKVVI